MQGLFKKYFLYTYYVPGAIYRVTKQYGLWRQVRKKYTKQIQIYNYTLCDYEEKEQGDMKENDTRETRMDDGSKA